MLHPYYRSSMSTSPLILPAKLVSAVSTVSALAAVVADPPSSPLPSLSDWPNPLLFLILR
jgi:hypothetical protein